MDAIDFQPRDEVLFQGDRAIVQEVIWSRDRHEVGILRIEGKSKGIPRMVDPGDLTMLKQGPRDRAEKTAIAQVMPEPVIETIPDAILDAVPDATPKDDGAIAPAPGTTAGAIVGAQLGLF